jgi:hypothetical protein
MRFYDTGISEPRRNYPGNSFCFLLFVRFRKASPVKMKPVNQGTIDIKYRIKTPRGRFELPRRKAPVAFEATAFPD